MTTIEPRIKTSEIAKPHEDISRGQDVRVSQGTVAPDSTQRQPKPWFDRKPLAKRLWSYSNHLAMESLD